MARARKAQDIYAAVYDSYVMRPILSASFVIGCGYLKSIHTKQTKEPIRSRNMRLVTLNLIRKSFRESFYLLAINLLIRAPPES